MSATTSFQDQTLKCKDCGKDFVWTADEQAFYQSKGFVNDQGQPNPPVRCPDCRLEKKKRFQAQRVMTTITCDECGKEDKVPFKPKGDKPVLCSDCFRKHKEQGEAGQAAQTTAEPITEQEIPIEKAA